MNWETKLQNWCDITGASHAGVTALSTPQTWPHYQAWLDQQLFADMEYLKDHAEVKRLPQTQWPEAVSAFVLAFPYVPHPEGPAVFSEARTALYARGRDYHHWLKERLAVIVTELQAEFPEHHFWIHTDSSPILERDLAARAGLGWFGKNTCLIHPQKGSLFLIGEILSSLKVESYAKPLPDFCGTCTRCLDICPTGALREPRVLQADLCISYWTIESRDVAPLELREKFGDWFFGCDLCQTVCPWNQKAFKKKASDDTTERALNTTLEVTESSQGPDWQARLGLQVTPLLSLSETSRTRLVEELRRVLTDSHNQTLKRLRGTALSRAGAKGLKRNALIVIGNQRLHELRTEVELLQDAPYFQELAQWTLQKLAD